MTLRRTLERSYKLRYLPFTSYVIKRYSSSRTRPKTTTSSRSTGRSWKSPRYRGCLGFSTSFFKTGLADTFANEPVLSAHPARERQSPFVIKRQQGEVRTVEQISVEPSGKVAHFRVVLLLFLKVCQSHALTNELVLSASPAYIGK